MINKSDLFPIGIGTWGIGGFAEKDSGIDAKKQKEAITYMFNRGMNFVEANLWYSQGSSAEILASALKDSKKKRDDVFICQAIYLKNGGGMEEAEGEVDKALKLFETNYIDSVQFSQSVFLEYEFDEITNFFENLFKNKKIRYTSITNEDLDLLRRYHKHFGERLFSHEVCFNLEVKENEKLGIIPYAKKNNILTVVYQPLRRNRTAQRNWPLLAELSKKYNVTQNQILLSWIASKGYLPLTKSENISHIDEHLASLEIKLKPEDIKELNDFTPPGYTSPEIDWDKSRGGVRMDQLSNIFDEEYGKQIKEFK